MKLPFPIRGTEEWDNREFERFTDGYTVMSFGKINEDALSGKWCPVKKRIRAELMERSIPKHVVEDFLSKRPKK